MPGGNTKFFSSKERIYVMIYSSNVMKNNFLWSVRKTDKNEKKTRFFIKNKTQKKREKRFLWSTLGRPSSESRSHLSNTNSS